MRADIEGLRAIAVLFVLVYHLGVDRLSGGFAGVDVFFVISGFLITSGLLSEAERSGTVSLLRFYARRARRLLPAATVVLVLTAIAGWQVMPRADWLALSTDVTAAALYVVNWALAFRAVDYLAEDAAVSPVQHYWSLSVEEQFYVVIPIMMIVLAWLARRMGWGVRAAITAAIALIVAVSLAYSIWHTATSPQTAYFFSTTRAWELGIGSLVACAVPLLRRLSERASAVIAAAGLTLIVVTGLVVSAGTPWPGSAALLPTVGTAAVIAAGITHSHTLVGRLLGLRPLVWIGGLSYSIYLWHWPLIILSGHVVDLTRGHKVAIAVASVGLAWLSKKLVEDPIRYGSLFAGRTRPTLVMGAAGMAMSLVAASFVWTQVPRLTERPPEAIGAEALMVTTADGRPTRRADVTPAVDREGLVYPSPAAEALDVPAYYGDDCQLSTGDTRLRERCVYGKPDAAFTVALTGDSKAGQWADVLDRIATERGWRLELYLKGSCGLNPAQIGTDCLAFNERVMDHLTSDHGRVDVVITGAGRGNNDIKNLKAPAQDYIDGYDTYWTRLEAVGTRVVAIGDVPSMSPLKPRGSCLEEHPDDLLSCAFPSNPGTGTESLRMAAALEPSRIFVDVVPWVCPETDDGQCPVVVGNTLVYRQGSHVTRTYAATMKPIFDWALDEIDPRHYGVARGALKASRGAEQ